MQPDILPAIKVVAKRRKTFIALLPPIGPSFIYFAFTSSNSLPNCVLNSFCRSRLGKRTYDDYPNQSRWSGHLHSGGNATHTTPFFSHSSLNISTASLARSPFASRSFTSKLSVFMCMANSAHRSWRRGFRCFRLCSIALNDTIRINL